MFRAVFLALLAEESLKEVMIIQWVILALVLYYIIDCSITSSRSLR